MSLLNFHVLESLVCAQTLRRICVVIFTHFTQKFPQLQPCIVAVTNLAVQVHCFIWHDKVVTIQSVARRWTANKFVPIQMALQLAYYRLHQKLVLTYESATTRLYFHGRTETIRPVSEQSVAFVRMFDDPTVPRDEVRKNLEGAIR